MGWRFEISPGVRRRICTRVYRAERVLQTARRCVDILIVGPGTGVTPFRAFVEERTERNASGKNWLFFGNPHFETDFLYQTEWLNHLKRGTLDCLDVAFSRDQSDKIYVQHRLADDAGRFNVELGYSENLRF